MLAQSLKHALKTVHAPVHCSDRLELPYLCSQQSKILLTVHNQECGANTNPSYGTRTSALAMASAKRECLDSYPTCTVSNQELPTVHDEQR